MDWKTYRGNGKSYIYIEAIDLAWVGDHAHCDVTALKFMFMFYMGNMCFLFYGRVPES